VDDESFLREGVVCSSTLALRPLVRRTLAGEAGAGCGRSRGLRLLNLCGPYDASFVGRAGDEETDGDAVAERVDAEGRAGRRADAGDVSAEEG
jgi:hypothetical protein